jgi:hypothetical protein
MRRLWLLLLLFLAACGTLPPAPTVPPDKAIVHLYRRALPVGPANLLVTADQRPIGSLGIGSRMDYLADPGPRVFQAAVPGMRSMPYATTLKGGQEYWFMVYFLGDQVTGYSAIAPVDAATAARQMAALKPAGP